MITGGKIDNRSIVDVRAEDLIGFDRVHFFAGIGVWDYALNRAGWGDRQVWTGSCPCQPFSNAGKRVGFTDERHLWPEFNRLISQCKPSIVFGEQVSGKDGLSWLDTVFSDLETCDYACGSLVIPACGVGAPHIRERLYWLGDTDYSGFQGHAGDGNKSRGSSSTGSIAATSVSGGLGDTDSNRCNSRHQTTETLGQGCANDTAGWTAGFWSDCEWLPFRDSKIRPVEPGSFPVVDGSPAVMGSIRAYGNAIVAPLAEEFIRSYLEIDRDFKN